MCDNPMSNTTPVIALMCFSFSHVAATHSHHFKLSPLAVLLALINLQLFPNKKAEAIFYSLFLL